MLSISPLTHAHTSYLYLSSNNDKDIRHFMPGCYCDTLEKATEFITNKLTDHTVQAYIIATNEHSFIGLLIISEQGKDLNNGKNCYEISYFIDRNFRKKGYATKVVEHILKQFKSCRIYLSIEDDNTASLLIAKKFGAIKEDDCYYYIDT